MDHTEHTQTTRESTPGTISKPARANATAARQDAGTAAVRDIDNTALSAVEAAMSTVAMTAESVGQAASDQLESGGKRLRARLALEAAHAATAQSGPPNVTWEAAAAELVHQASLVHDDLMDQDPQRRGRTSVWQHYGADTAILLGDHLLAAAFDAAARGHSAQSLVPRLAAAVQRAVSGQAREIPAAEVATTPHPVSAYELRVREKSGRLMALPVEAGLIGVEVDTTTIDTARVAWTALGAAYQVGDDLAELEGRKPGRARQADLIQRRLSAPIAHYLASQGAANAQSCRDFLAEPTGTSDSVDAWHHYLITSDAPRRCREHHERLVHEARATATSLPNALRQVLETSIERIALPRPDVLAEDRD